ncbi:hypothetical protein [Ideonella livida]|uniref:Uncharacterized protein n=1 Tax=Ideonella livida TaxID=2707176 RepID=A0A7C9TKM2_9BURK|nr:hypothetical protein [Ideonella livida]NDY90987.1 hypothetical protein [Ideonella livida]
MSTLTSHTYGLRPMRAASLRQVLTQQALAAARGVWTALEQLGQRRAVQELQRTAAMYRSSRPELADQLARLARDVQH